MLILEEKVYDKFLVYIKTPDISLYRLKSKIQKIYT